MRRRLLAGGQCGRQADLTDGRGGPPHALSAQGHNGQVTLIFPSKAVVIVRLALTDDGDAAWKALGAWLTPVVNALPDARAI